MVRRPQNKLFSDQTQSNQPDKQQMPSYRLGDWIGNESRSLELKQGPGFVRHNFRENVAKYLCGWANSHENGTLMLGIDNDGNVIGYGLKQREEDHLRLQIDEAVKDIRPMILPTYISVQFVPVVNSDDKQTSNSYGPVKVIEIYIEGSKLGTQEDLYSARQSVYVRRDGGIQELKAEDIQSWIKQKHKAEIDKLKKNEENLIRENKRQASFVRNLSDKTIKQQEEINLLKQQQLVQQSAKSNNKSAKKDKKSKTCALS